MTRLVLGSALVIAKEPVPGRVKTRLTPPFAPVEAAELAAAALLATLHAVRDVLAQRHVLVLAGSPDGLLPPGWRYVAQGAGGLDVRLAAAFTAVAGGGPAVLVGMDTPQLHAEQLNRFAPSRFDCCFGPAVDGGFWAIGFADPRLAAQVIPGVVMSRPDTGLRQLDRLRAAGLRVQMLDELVDVDTAETALEVAELAPGTAFAACLARLSAGHLAADQTGAERLDLLAAR